jgi:hypothetical protein
MEALSDTKGGELPLTVDGVTVRNADFAAFGEFSFMVSLVNGPRKV